VVDFVLMEGTGAKWGNDHASGDGVSDFLYQCLLAKRHACICATDAIQLNDLLPSLLLESGHRLGDGLAATFDLQHVAGSGANLPQRFGVEPGDAASHIIAPRFGDRQGQFLAIR
jgi:hypothetical protein